MIRGWLVWLIVLVSCLIFARPGLGAESPEQLLATARDGNRAAILSIRSMECRYERVPWANTPSAQANKYFFMHPGRFWRSGDTYRLVKPMGDGTTLEYVVRSGQGFWLRKGGPLSHPILTREPPGPVDGVGGEMWQHLLFSHWGWLPPPRASFYTLHEILQHPYVLHAAERLPPPASEIHVVLSHGGVKLQEFWFDSKVNYLIRKSVWIPAGDTTLRWEHEVIDFAEAAPAVFVPTTIEHRCFVSGKQQAVIRTILYDLRVNHAMPASALRIPGIAGMDCIDPTRNVKFKVDADGNSVGPESKVKVHRITPEASIGTSPPVGYSSPEPSQQPTSWWVWLLIISVVVLMAAILVGILRRRARMVQA